ncbi:hypothetical protein M1P56_09760 [Streptomyces sp. HU2014]|uniref:hypothetical protein n=1 Tax=Streptomyces sp. HU2014 TaxID=2939414 RepID=UPI00200F5478|nr:hypothetical protein [Streptomyces sp. HU2014]UQI44611.1 hypothetical protein M1P56_09760 [Streptomyces sp. HU2014]
MTGWRYEVWVCDAGHTKAEEHDGFDDFDGFGDDGESCGAWKRTEIHWNENWFNAFEQAANQEHAYVQAVPVDTALPWRPRVAFEHVKGGGLCKGCWARHENTHAEHTAAPSSGDCPTCAETRRTRRGPLTRTPFGTEFMCEDCRATFRRLHERESREPDKRLYRAVLDVARGDAGV